MIHRLSSSAEFFGSTPSRPTGMVGAWISLIAAAASNNLMMRLKSQPKRATRSNRPLRLIFLLLLLGLLTAVVAERWRGQLALGRWKSEMTAKGEIFEAQRLWPPASEANLEFSNRLAQVTGALRGTILLCR